MRLSDQGTVGIAGNQEDSFFGWGNLRGAGGCGDLAGDQALVGALAQMPQHHAHNYRGHEEYNEKNALVAGNRHN
jgi:hypothetical protein